MWMVLSTGLQIEILVNLELSPDKIGLLPSLGESPPASSLEQAPYKLRVITLSHIYFELSLLCYWSKENAIRKCYFPYKISIIVSLKRSNECFYFRFARANPFRVLSFS